VGDAGEVTLPVFSVSLNSGISPPLAMYRSRPDEIAQEGPDDSLGRSHRVAGLI
jgi:hypothetical protein